MWNDNLCDISWRENCLVFVGMWEAERRHWFAAFWNRFVSFVCSIVFVSVGIYSHYVFTISNFTFVTLVFWPAHFPFRCTFFRAPSQLMGHLRTFASRPGFFMELFEKIFLWGNLLIRPGKLNPSSCIYGCHLLLVNHHFVWIVNRGPFELHIPNLPWEAQKNQVGYLPWNF